VESISLSSKFTSARACPRVWLNTTQFWLCIAIGIICTILEPVLGILGGTLVSFLATAMSSSKNQKTCVVDDVQLPHALGSCACMRIVSVMGEVTFSNAAAIAKIGTDHPSPRRTLFASDARDVSYLVASLSSTSEASVQRLSVAVQTVDTQQREYAPPTESVSNIRVCVLDLSRITMVDVDGADAIGTIGQHLARLTKQVRDATGGGDTLAAQSHVYVVIGNEAPKNLYTDMWLSSKLSDGMVFRSMHGALREWRKCIEDAAALPSTSGCAAAGNMAAILGLESIIIAGAVAAPSSSPPSPALQSRPVVMRNRAGSFSVDMRARQGSFHL
jgi:hypothetical protein